MVKTSGCQQFLMLLYKGLLLRKRHYITTAFEIIIPIIACSSVLLSLSAPEEAHSFPNDEDRLWRKESSENVENATIYSPTDPFHTTIEFIRMINFIYTPNTEIAGNLVDDAIALWKNKTNFRGVFTKKAMDTEEDLVAFALYSDKSVSSDIIGTVFNNFNVDTLPESLDYKIRYASIFNTFFTTMKYRIDGPHPSNVYSDTYFLSWQAAVEESFIQETLSSLKGNDQFNYLKSHPYKVMMQRFPYPEHKNPGNQNFLINMIPWAICYGFLVFTISLVRRVTDEKSNGSKELMKMMGMKDKVYWLGTFVNYFLEGALVILIISILYKVPIKSSMLLPETDFFLLLVLLFLFMASTILFAITFTTFIPHRIFCGILLTVVTVVSLALLTKDVFLPGSNIRYFLLSKGEKLSICLLPFGAALTIFALISSFEASGEGAQWSNLTQYGASPDINLLWVITMMVVSCLMYSVIIWYIDAVWPWQNGIPKPFYFPFTKHYWFDNCYNSHYDEESQPISKHSDSQNEEYGSISQRSEFFEAEPAGSTPGVVIKNLTKTFKSWTRTKAAVNNVSLSIYYGEITALLGHNGAGKTTTINILTGLFPPTSGTATIGGKDILHQTTMARRSLGVCPQTNILYDTLTPDEHLKFYAGLKGVKCGNLAKASEDILKMLNLTEKKNELVKKLSGGMKRKLSLGIALIGGSEVLVLDEPTSGMDPEASRSVWDALLDIRKHRTIILTTHQMEEADILGDRIAIMANGEIQCCGSSMFLKKKLGTGYKLNVVKDTGFNMDEITEILQSFMPDATLEKDSEKEVTFNLSCGTDLPLVDMLERLESSQSALGIESFGISVTTMEDVFLNAAKIAELKHKSERTDADSKSEIISNGKDIYTQQEKLSNSYMLALNRLSALLVKRFHCSRRSWVLFIVQIALPLLLMVLLLFAIKRKPQLEISTFPALQLQMENVYGRTQGFYSSSDDQVAQSFAGNYKAVLEDSQVAFPATEPSFNPQDYILQFASRDLAGYLKTLMAGGVIRANQSLTLTAWYNGEPFHTMPIALNMMHNAVLRSISGARPSISLTNAPLPYATASENAGDTLSVYIAQLAATLLVPLALSFLPASYILFPVEERASKSKLLQVMTGLPVWLYWGAMFLWDISFHIIVCILLLIPFAVFDASVFFSDSDVISSIFLLLFLYGWCSIPLCYAMSFLFKKPNTAFQIIMTIYISTGLILSSVMTAVGFAFGGFAHKDLPNEINIAMWIFRIFPSFSVSNGIANVFGIAFSRAVCEDMSDTVLEQICNASHSFDNPMFKCCKDNKGHTPTISWDSDKCGREILYMTLEGFIFFALLLFLETTIPRSFWRCLKRKIKATIRKIRHSPIEMLIRDTTAEDSEVRLEEQRIEDLCQMKASDEERLMVHNLSKIYKNLYAVDHLSFGVHKEECFGLLGVNGAGKTSTFKMITGDVLPSEGNAFIQDFSLIQDRELFQSCIGYCPQYDALLNRLTGIEMLTLFAKLRGLTGKNMQNSITQLIRMVDLQEHADKLTKHYSGGNKRKLSLALALIGTPPVILLDEPTSGVDPASRRKIWKILEQVRSNAGAAIILTTHSMEESEALCDRLAIMVNGKFRCLGSLQQLKTKYGEGHTVTIKLKREELDRPQAMNSEKAYFEAEFPSARLADDHQGMLQYHISEPSRKQSEIFKIMDEMKRNLNLQDYLISGTSLEQIFLTFARAQRQSDVEYV